MDDEVALLAAHAANPTDRTLIGALADYYQETCQFDKECKFRLLLLLGSTAKPQQPQKPQKKTSYWNKRSIWSTPYGKNRYKKLLREYKKRLAIWEQWQVTPNEHLQAAV